MQSSGLQVTRKQDSAKARITAEDLKQMLAEDGDLLKTIVEQRVQQVLEAEMDEALQAGKSERSEQRMGYRSGYYGRTLITRVGKIELRVPQDRQRRFRTEVFERYQRSEKALVAAMLEMYVQGVSTRKVKSITEELCGHVGSYLGDTNFSVSNSSVLTQTVSSSGGGKITPKWASR